MYPVPEQCVQIAQDISFKHTSVNFVSKWIVFNKCFAFQWVPPNIVWSCKLLVRLCNKEILVITFTQVYCSRYILKQTIVKPCLQVNRFYIYWELPTVTYLPMVLLCSVYRNKVGEQYYPVLQLLPNCNLCKKKELLLEIVFHATFSTEQD